MTVGLALLPEHLRGDGPCGDCGTLDNIVWFTDNVLWNAVTGENVVHEQKPVGILCVTCFVARVYRAGFWPMSWRLVPEWPVRTHKPCPHADWTRVVAAVPEHNYHGDVIVCAHCGIRRDER